MRNPVRLLETTLRDGSYEVDFQFTAADTALLVDAFEQAGITYIEVAHGSGIGADDWTTDQKPSIRAACSDRRHIEVACSVAKKAQVGALCVVGKDWTPVERLIELHRVGMKFVRLAFFPSGIEGVDELSYIDKCKNAGLTVSINLMKTYALPPAKIGQFAHNAEKRGADWFYIVDSAGGMSRNTVKEYVRAIREASGLEVGLHAHNNCGLALANCLAAIEAGATLVDGSLQGIGRATGNPSTEQLLLALQRDGHEEEVDTNLLLTLGSSARALFAAKGNDPVFFASGSASLHSRALPRLTALAMEQRKNPIDVVLSVGRKVIQAGLLDRETFPAELAAEATASCREVVQVSPSDEALKVMTDSIEEVYKGGLLSVCEELFVRAMKHRQKSALQLCKRRDFPYEGPVFWQTPELVGVTLTIDDQPLPPLPKGRAPDCLLIDNELQTRSDLPVPHTLRALRSFSSFVADATVELIAELFREGDQLSLPSENSPLTRRLLASLEERGIKDGKKSGRSLLVIDAARLSADEIARLRQGDVVVVFGHSPDLRTCIDQIRLRQAQALRPPVWWTVAAFAALRLRLHARLSRPLTAVMITDGLKAVDPLVCEATHEAVVDATESPTTVISSAGPRTADEVARARARVLLSGRGEI